MDRRVVLIGVGNTILIAAGMEETGGAFTLLDYELAPGFTALPPHSRQYEDTGIYVLEGALLVQIGSTEHMVGPGEFIFLPKEIVQAQRNPGSCPVRFLTICIPAGFERCLFALEAVVEGGVPCSPEAVATLLAGHGVQVDQAGSAFTWQKPAPGG